MEIKKQKGGITVKKWIIVILSISIIAIIIGGSLVYKNNIENQMASEKSYYHDYVDENGGMSFSSDIKAIHSFIESYSHKN